MDLGRHDDTVIRCGMRTTRSLPHEYALAVFVLFGASCVIEAPSEGAIGALVVGRPCSEQIAQTLVELGAVGEARLEPQGTDGPTYRLATRELGTWVVVGFPTAARSVLTTWTPVGAEVREFGEGCTVHVRQESHSLVSGNAPRDVPLAHFTDRDVRWLVERASSAPGSIRGTVLYVWAPHMPLSVDGYGEIVEAATRLGLDVVPLLATGSDHDFALQEATRVGIPESGLREIRSVELHFRDAQVHAPAILVVLGGRMSAVLPGYRNADGYARYLLSLLDSD